MIVINLFAGPGAGKSTTCAGLFYKLKMMGVNCEMALEYAKDKVWEQSFRTLENQIYIFGKQLHRIWRLKDQVDIVITDSPLLLSIHYDNAKSKYFADLVKDEFNKFNNYNYFITRNEFYNPKGRMQTLEESKDIDCNVKNILDENKIIYATVSKDNAVDDIINDLKALNIIK